MTNQGEVTTAQAVDALRIIGNGGAITYSGNGGVTNSSGRDAGLFVTNADGDISIATGAGAVSGTIGIGASTTGGGAVTIATGSGLVSGSAGPGVSAATADGALNVRIGSGGVTGVEHPGVELTTNNGDISVIANGDVSGLGLPNNKGADIYGIEATSNGLGNISIGGSGTAFGQYGRGIFAFESPTGLGGIVVTGTGDTMGGSTTLGCPRVGVGGCSGIRAWIDNPADSSDIVINRSGDVASNSSPVNLETASIHAVTAGAGDIVVATGAGAAITNTNLFAIIASAYGQSSTGSITVTTGANGILSSSGVGVFAYNEAKALPVAAGSFIKVTNNATIAAGAGLNPINPNFTGGGSGTPTTLPAGILAGYNGVPVFGPTSGPYTSCGVQACVTLRPDPNVNGTVTVINDGAIGVAGGYGVFAYNFGNGAVSVTSNAPIVVTGATAQNGIKAFSAESGAVTVTTTSGVSAVSGAGVFADSVGKGAVTVDVVAGVVQGGASGVAAHAADGAITIVNSGTIQNISQLPGYPAVRTSGGVATLINNSGAIVTGTVSMTGAGTNGFANAGVWNTRATSTFAGASSLDNSGVVNVLGAATALRGLTSLTNSGILNLVGGDRTLTTPGYVGAGGVLAISAYLGGDNAPGGKLVVDGGSATGHTVVIVNNAGGRGAPTPGNGVEVVAAINGATTAPGAFTLGNRVAAGAYGYQLYDGGNAASGGDPNDQNWYLRSSYRPEVPLDAAIPALASRFGLDMLGTYHDRVGEDGVFDAAAPDGPIEGQLSRLAGWGRLFGETGSGLVGGGPGSGFGLSGFQTGVDLYRRANADRSQDLAGLYLGAGAATASVNQPTGSAAGDLSMDGYTLGGYWTHRGPSGWYLDAVAQATRFDNVAADFGGRPDARHRRLGLRRLAGGRLSPPARPWPDPRAAGASNLRAGFAAQRPGRLRPDRFWRRRSAVWTHRRAAQPAVDAGRRRGDRDLGPRQSVAGVRRRRQHHLRDAFGRRSGQPRNFARRDLGAVRARRVEQHRAQCRGVRLGRWRPRRRRRPRPQLRRTHRRQDRVVKARTSELNLCFPRRARRQCRLSPQRDLFCWRRITRPGQPA